MNVSATTCALGRPVLAGSVHEQTNGPNSASSSRIRFASAVRSRMNPCRARSRRAEVFPDSSPRCDSRGHRGEVRKEVQLVNDGSKIVEIRQFENRWHRNCVARGENRTTRAQIHHAARKPLMQRERAPGRTRWSNGSLGRTREEHRFPDRPDFTTFRSAMTHAPRASGGQAP